MSQDFTQIQRKAPVPSYWRENLFFFLRNAILIPLLIEKFRKEYSNLG